MELHAIDRIVAMLEAHDDSILGLGGDLQMIRQRFSVDDQRVITGRDERIRQSLEDPLAIVLDERCLAMHQLRSADHISAEGIANRLMSETHAQHRNLAGHMLDDPDRNPGLARRAWSRGNDHAIELGAHRVDFVERDLVVAAHHHIRAELGQELVEIEGERVVVVDEQNHDCDSVDAAANDRSSDSMRSASSMARISAPILW